MYVSIIGRSNVGKSTLFNRIQKSFSPSRLAPAMVSEKAGTTREGKSVELDFGTQKIILRDSGGWEEHRLVEVSPLVRKMRDRVIAQIKDANLIVFVVDAMKGVTPLDREVGRTVRELTQAPTVLVANKAENIDPAELLGDMYELDLGDPLFVSGKFNKGMTELFDRMDEGLRN
jgi:GTPase